MTDFRSGPWHCVGTPIADKDKCSGLATLVHSRLGPAEAIQCKTYLKGRVTLTRIHQKFGALDVINVYQHVWRSKHTTAQNQASRASVYRAVGQALNASPIRNTCILGGDFNTEVRALSPHVGKALLARSGHGGTEDGDEGLLELLQTHGLCLLNTWHGKHKATNVTSGSYSQIDFIAVRVQWADRVAKQSTAQPECPAGAWKTNRHFPVRASAKLVAPWHLIRKNKPANAQINKLEMQSSIATQDARARDLREKVADDISRLSPQTGLGELTVLVDEILRKHAAAIYPATPASDQRLCRHPVFNHSAKALFWKLYKEYRSIGKCNRGNILRKWRLWTRFRQASKQMRADVKVAKRQQITDTMLELEQAATRGDQGGIYVAVRRLAPWKPAAKPSIRGKTGEFLPPAQQLRELCRHATAKFCQGTDYQPKGTLQAGMQVTVAQLQEALQRLPVRKAAPQTAAPSALWKNSAAALSQLFWAPLSEAWGPGAEGSAPPIWKDAQMVWMPKPQKDSSILANLRPIGLVHPMGKSVTVVLRTRLVPTLMEALVTRPQFAYAKGRSTLDALLRAHGHLTQTRQVVEACKSSIYARHSGQEPNPCFGGLCFSLDLKGAFDAVPRSSLAESLFRLRVDPELVHLIMHMQYQAQYWNNVGADTRPVTPTQGIKQGCCIAPYLFVAYTIMVMDKLSAQMKPGWQEDNLTWYADDAFAAWLVRGVDDLRQALGDIRTIISVLRDNGMEIQPDKCAVLLNLHGKEKSKILKHHIVHHQEQAHLVISTLEEVYIPIKKHHEYLGTVLAYRDPQTLTLQHRMGKAKGRYALLRKTLHARRLISSKHRYRIWKAGVPASACYGLLATGVTVTGRAQLLAMAARQLRALAGRPAHLTHENNESIRKRFGCIELTEELYKSATSRHKELLELRRTQPENIVTKDIAIKQLEHAMATFQTIVPVECPTRGGAEGIGFPCPVCGVYFDSRTSMKKHVALKHPEHKQKEIKFDPAVHAIGGLPQCAACGHKFQRWQALRNHITNDNCPALGTQVEAQVDITKVEEKVAEASARDQANSAVVNASSTSPALPPASQQVAPEEAVSRVPPYRQQLVHQIIREQGWEALVTSAVAQELQQHCCLCAKWIVDPTALKRHIRMGHKELWARVSAKLDTTCAVFKSRLARDGCCPYCNRTSYNRHFKQCCVIFQSAILGLLHGSDGGLQGADPDVRVPHAGAERHAQEATSHAVDRSTQGGGSGRAGKAKENTPGKGREPSIGPSAGADQGHGKSPGLDLPHSDSTRGQHQRGQDGSGVHGVHGPDRTSRTAHESVPGQRGVEQSSGNRAQEDHAAPEDHAAYLDDRGAAGQAAENGAAPGGQEAGSHGGLDGRQRKTAVPKVGRGKQKVAPPSHDARPANPRCSADTQGTGAAHPGGPGASLPCAAKAEANARGRKQGGVQARDLSQTSRSQRDVSVHGQAGEQRSLAAYWLPTPQGRHAKGQSGTGVDEDAQSRRPSTTSAQTLLLEARLHNSTNTCYLNAFFHALVWQVTTRTETRLPQAWLAALRQVSVKPLSLLRFFLLGWEQPHVQHDVAELASLLLRQLSWLPCVVSWSRRLQVERGLQNLQAMQDSRIWHLDPSGGLQSSVLQDAINSWHGRITVQALHSPADTLWVQLPRFVHEGTDVRKVAQTLRLDSSHRHFRVPVFRSPDSVEISWHEYCVSAAIYHLGQTVHAGHYRSILFHPQVEGGWHTEDERPAVWCDTVPTAAEDNCYLLCATRSNT